MGLRPAALSEMDITEIAGRDAALGGSRLGGKEPQRLREAVDRPRQLRRPIPGGKLSGMGRPRLAWVLA